MNQLKETIDSTRRENATIEEEWSTVTDALQKTSENILGFINYERKEWISDTTWKIILERKETKEMINHASETAIRDLKLKYAQLDKNVSKSARKDKRKYLEDMAAQAQRTADSNNMRETYRLTQKLTNRTIKTDRPLKAADGSLLTTEVQQINRWTEHFEELLNKPSENIARSPIGNIARARRFNEDPPNVTEIKVAIKLLKDGKAPGADNIPAELLKVDIEFSTNILKPIIEQVWEAETIPLT